MADQQDPISPDEYVLRRISKDKNRYDPSLPQPIQRLSFEASPLDKNGVSPDINGISVFREIFVSAEAVAKAGGGARGYCVVRLRASDVTALGLTIIPDPRDDQLPGHALIPELGFLQMKQDKLKCKELQRHLVKLACNSIVFETQ